VVSGFTKRSFLSLDQKLIRRILPVFLYNSLILRLKDCLSYFVNFEKKPL
jgi:hypothetical protein